MAQPRGAREPVAVLAATAAEAASAARALASRLPGIALSPASLDGYLKSRGASHRVVLCVTRPGAARARAFLSRALARLLWPAPGADLADAVGGLLDHAAAPRGRRAGRASAASRQPGPRSALLLEGAVDDGRARAALAAAPRDWIVESVRHVRLSARELALCARSGVVWSALEPVELVAVYASAAPSGGLGLPAGTPVWVRPVRRVRRSAPR